MAAKKVKVGISLKVIDSHYRITSLRQATHVRMNDMPFCVGDLLDEEEAQYFCENSDKYSVTIREST